MGMQNVMPLLSESALRELRARYEAYRSRAGGVKEYLAARGLSAELVDAAGLGFVGDDPLPGDEAFQGHLSIPYANADGVVVGMRFRRLDGDGPKYTSRAGDRALLYNARLITGAAHAHVCEGELDALSLAQCGLLACGLPGASTWKPWYALLFEGCERVTVWTDGDEAGDEAWRKISRDLPLASRAPVPRGMDVNALLVERGPSGVRGLIGLE